jgi:hypothetical protein
MRYDSLYWGTVFALSMYTTGTHQMSHAMEFGLLEFFAPIFLNVALVVEGDAPSHR